ncbi:hypothetical protein ATE47_03510 [Chryseobacterium sp. IHB B 17019]|jgi:hypothetical protein|uniref:hypothetical protein n=1 Tax=Chryseobacterium sp. IHB B 17019 TaxID=1721091 RepID=UPI00071EB307|nr:hypothetical protein [Chryseobacterium sp. IHB B 17019]ALR29649.1 hypothetical protein ATE47_03510 [Chryseobacterium sp. IHB B 17019]
MVRRCYKNFPNSTFVFAHPFVRNPEAQFLKNNIEFNSGNFRQFVQKNVGQFFFHHEKSSSSFHHFGIDKFVMGNFKVLSPFESKVSIKNNKVFTEFQDYIKLCNEYSDEIVNDYIQDLTEYTGGTTDRNKDYYSKLISYLKRGIVIHHGSLP